jgi:hypothetical protein
METGSILSQSENTIWVSIFTCTNILTQIVSYKDHQGKGKGQVYHCLKIQYEWVSLVVQILTQQVS